MTAAARVQELPEAAQARVTEAALPLRREDDTGGWRELKKENPYRLEGAREVIMREPV